MFSHFLTASLSLPLPRRRVFDFFSEAGNLERITPPELHFHILTPLPIEMRVGTRIDYRLRLYGIPLTWETEITRWEPPIQFVDEQIRGPYAQWIHRHRFTEAAPQRTIIEDHVQYKLPWSPWGEIVFPLIRVQLKRIFDYRQKTVLDLLAPQR